MTILTTGVTGSLVARQEIRTMLLDKELFTLYILALTRFQQTDQADLLSYFQIAGIHGRPYVAYDGATGVGNFGGYCTHSSILFPPWHRPYLALFEQSLNKHVNDVANEYTAANKNTYIAAAKRFRIPYWDWALTADLPDVVAKQHQLTLDTPQGVQTIPNPLYTYTFHPLYQDFGDGLSNEQVWESWRSTYRYPTSQTANAQSDDATMESTLDNNRLTIRDRTYNLLTNATNYAAFSNDGFLNGMGPTGYESLESIHNSIHGLTGRDGHMGVVDFSAFDPLFWMHHTNVDRVFAMWQALNPQSYVIPRENQGGTFATRAGTIEDANTPLAPFWKSQGVFWTAAGVRDTRTFNYTYPELVNWANLDPSTKNARIRSDINAMYGNTAAWGTLNPGIFNNVQPSVPTVAPSASSFGTPAIPGKPAAHAVPAVSSKVAVLADRAPEAKVASSAGGSAQVAIKAPFGKSYVDSIRKTLEEDVKVIHDKVAAAVHDVVEKVEGALHHVEDEYHHKNPVDYKSASEYPQAPPPTTYKPTPPVGYSEPPTGYKPTPPVEPPTGYKPVEHPTGYKPTPPVEPPTGYKPTPPVEAPTGYNPTPPVEPPIGYKPVEHPTGYKPTPPVEPPTGYTPTPPTGYKPTPPSNYHEPPTGYRPPPQTTHHEPPSTYTPAPPATYKPTPPTEYPHTPIGYQPTPAQYKPPTDYGRGPVDTGVAYAGKKDYIEWIANINVEKYAAKSTFFVYIFLGDFNPDSTKWAQEPNLVGIHVVFANNMTYTGCERCRDQAEQRKLVTGTIPLTGALGDKLGKSKVGSLQPDEVIPYLKKELHWRIQTHDQKVIERADMPSLKISVASIPVTLPENINEFPTWGQGSRQTDVTTGRPGGANHNDQE